MVVNVTLAGMKASNRPIGFRKFRQMHAAFVLMFPKNNSLYECIMVSHQNEVLIDVRDGDEEALGKLNALLKIAGVPEDKAGWRMITTAVSLVNFVRCSINGNHNIFASATRAGIAIPGGYPNE